MKFLKSLLVEEDGQTMTEYVIILLLIAIALIGGWMAFGRKLWSKLTKATTDLDKLDVDYAE